MNKQRRYNDHEKAAALAALESNDHNVKKTASETGIPAATLRDWRDERRHAPPPELVQKARVALADRLEELAHKIVDQLFVSLEGAPLKDLSVSAGIVVDKMRLLREQATSISGAATNLSHEERATRIAELLRAAQQRAVGGPAHPAGTNGTGITPGASRPLEPPSRPANGSA